MRDGKGWKTSSLGTILSVIVGNVDIFLLDYMFYDQRESVWISRMKDDCDEKDFDY